jgi:hypothetical protein
MVDYWWCKYFNNSHVVIVAEIVLLYEEDQVDFFPQSIFPLVGASFLNELSL